MIANVLRANKQLILERWAAELKRTPASERHGRASVRKIRANTVNLLGAIISVFESPDSASRFKCQAIVNREASYLGELRQAQGFQLADVVEDYVSLRKVILGLLTEEVGIKDIEARELEWLGLALDAALKATVQAFHEVDRDELLELANLDSLTGLPNNSHFWLRLGQEVARATRYGHTLAVLMIDIDDFKQFNDAHGHLCGDLALESLVTVVASALRTTDVVARYGGEEFAVVLPETDAPRARMAAERVRQAVASHSVTGSDGRQYSLTVSIGCAACEGQAMTGKDLVEAADWAMYTAKKMGKNCCFVWLPKSGEAHD